MRAIVLRATGGVDVLRLEDVERPRPGARDVLVHCTACGVYFLDVVTRNGEQYTRRGLRAASVA